MWVTTMRGTEQGCLFRRRPCAPLYKLTAHSHMSEIYAINTADTSLTAPLKAFVDALR
jgi:hypothetical protein